jgi:hypothetical protein
MALLGEWQLAKPALNSVENIEGGEGPLTVSYTANVDTRFDDVVLGPLVTTVSCAGADAAGGGSVGTPATANCFAFSESMEAKQYMVVGRGTKLAIIDLSDRSQDADGTMAGAGAPFAAVTDLFFTLSAAGTEEISVGFDDTIYQVITAISGTGITSSANNESMKFRIFGHGGSDAAAGVIAGLGRASGTPMNKVYSNTLSGSTTMDASAWQSRATISGEAFTFTGFALDGRFWLVGTSNGLYFLDSDGQRYRSLMEEVPNDPDAIAGFGLQGISYLGPGVLAPLTRSLRLCQSLNSRSVGVEMFRNNTSPVQGRYGRAGASELWIYLPIYNTITGESYICAVRPRQPGDGHGNELSFYPIIELDTLESKFCVFSEHKGGVTRPTMWAGSGSNVIYWEEGNLPRFPDDTGYVYATSGTLYGTKLRRQPWKKKKVETIELTTSGCNATNYIVVDIVYVDHMGVEQTVRCGGRIESNGHHSVEVPGKIEAHEFYPKLTFTGSGSTSTPRVKYGNLRVYGTVMP